MRNGNTRPWRRRLKGILGGLAFIVFIVTAASLLTAFLYHLFIG